MLSFLLSLINPAKAIARELADAYIQKQNAQTEQKRIEADVKISQLEARQRALTEGEPFSLSKIVQALWAAPFIIYTWKLIVWDKVLKYGTTDPLGQFELRIGMIIVGFYFLQVSGGYLIRRIKRG